MNSVLKKLKIKIISVTIIGTMAFETVGPPIKKLIDINQLINIGLSRENATNVIMTDVTYIDPRIDQYVIDTVVYMQDTFPNINFNKDVGSFYIVDELNISSAAGANIPQYEVSIAESNYEETQLKIIVTHEIIHQLLFHGRYHGFYDTLTKKGNRFNEIFVDYLTYKALGLDINETNLYGIGYQGKNYFAILEKFISLEDLVKIAREGTTKDVERLLSQYFKNVDIIDLFDAIYDSKSNNKDNIESEISDISLSDELAFAFIDAYFEKLMNNNIIDPKENIEYYEIRMNLKAYPNTKIGLYFQEKEEQFLKNRVR